MSNRSRADETTNTRIPVSKEARDDAREEKRDDEDWSDFIRRCTDAEPGIQRVVDANDLEGVIRRVVREELDRCEREAGSDV